MAVTRSSGPGRPAAATGSRKAGAGYGPQADRPQAVEGLTSVRTVTGPVRPGRKTKLLVKHLVRGDIALVDHLDIDRVSAEELIAAGAVAVLNCRSSTTGSYPNLGPQLLVEAGVLLVDLPDDALFEELSDGDPVTVNVQGGGQNLGGELLRRGAPLTHGEVLYRGALLTRGEVLDLARVRAETEARRHEIGEALERFAHNTIEHMREERELLAGRVALPHGLSRPFRPGCGAWR